MRLYALILSFFLSCLGLFRNEFDVLASVNPKESKRNFKPVNSPSPSPEASDKPSSGGVTKTETGLPGTKSTFNFVDGGDRRALEYSVQVGCQTVTGSSLANRYELEVCISPDFKTRVFSLKVSVQCDDEKDPSKVIAAMGLLSRRAEHYCVTEKAHNLSYKESCGYEPMAACGGDWYSTKGTNCQRENIKYCCSPGVDCSRYQKEFDLNRIIKYSEEPIWPSF